MSTVTPCVHKPAKRCAIATLQTLVCGLFIVSGTVALAQRDFPTGPAGVSAPGVSPPEFPQQADAPAISMISDITFPGETLVITGAGLDGATLRVWAGGKLAEVAPLKSADDRMLAVLPAELPLSTTLVWPVKGDRIGRPIRVNAPVVWWRFPTRVLPGKTVRLFGKNLSLKGATSRVCLEPGGRWLEIVNTNPYQIEAQLPDKLAPGEYKLWTHNGTGGQSGWSDPVDVRVMERPADVSRAVFRVEDYRQQGMDDSSAIQAAIAAAARAGGGQIVFSKPRYALGTTITTPANVAGGLHLRAEDGMRARPILEPVCDAPLPPVLLRVGTRFSTIRGLEFRNGADGGKQFCVEIAAHDVTVEQCRFLIEDKRDWSLPMEKRRHLLIDNGALQLNAPGEANIVVRDCEFETPGAGVRIGLDYKERTEPYTNFTCIQRCRFVGTFQGVYAIPRRKGKSGQFIGPQESGYRSSGVVNDNGIATIVEHCEFRGADRAHGKVMGRSIQCHNSAVRHQYWAHNTCRDVGNHSSLGTINRNMGEQFMFHIAYDPGGIFHVTKATDRTVTLDLADPRLRGQVKDKLTVTSPAGSVLRDEVGKNDYWIVFICAGRGVGQWRVVSGAQAATLTVDRSWRVVPDATSRVVLTVSYRQNIVYANTIHNTELDKDHKNHGVIFWYNGFDNVIAGNRFHNQTAGVVFNHGFRNPTAWNLTRDNVMTQMYGMTGDTSRSAALYVDHYRWSGAWPAEEDRVWYSVGDIARCNRGDHATVAAYVHTRGMERRRLPEYPSHRNGGIMLKVVERNEFSEVDEGIVVSAPANWLLLRENTVQPTSPQTPPAYDETLKKPLDPAMTLRVE